MAYKFNPFTGNLDEVGSPGGSDTQIQFNDAGSFGGDVDLTWNKTTNVMTVAGDVNLSDGGSFTTTLQTITPTANRTVSIPDATGTLALVAGSSGQLLWNNAGANAGASTLTYDGSILTTSGRFINSYNSGSLAPAKTFTGTWATGAGTTNTKPHVLIETTGATSNNWSNSGTGLGVNAASGFSGNLLDFQVNGTRQLNITSGGTIRAGALAVSPIYGYSDATSAILDTTASRNFAWNGADLRLRGSIPFGWANGDPASTSADLVLIRDAANTLAQRNGGTSSVPVPQTSRIYNYYASATDYERGKLEWSSNAFRIGTEKGSGGGTARALELQTDGTTRATVDTSGRLLVGTSTARSNTFNGVTQGGALQVELSGGGSQPQAVFGVYSGGTTPFPGPVCIYGATRSTTVGGNILVADNDRIALLSFQGNDGSEFVESASISAFVDGTPGTNDMPGRLLFSTTSDGAASPTERFRITNDGVRGYNQPAPAAVDTTATLTVANLKTGIITSSTAAAVTMTLPTGTLTEGGFSGLYNNFTFEWTVINTGATNAVTVQGGTDHTLVGSGTIAAGVSGRFASRRTATNTFVTYRLS